MRARYLGDHENMVAWGIRFPCNQFVRVDDPHAQMKIKGNNHFEIETIDAEDVEFVEVPRIIAKDESETNLSGLPAEFISSKTDELIDVAEFQAVALAEDEMMDVLRSEAEKLGIAIDGRWKAKRLAEEIEKAKG